MDDDETTTKHTDSPATGRHGSNFKSIIFKLILNNSFGTQCENILLRWMSQNLTDKKSMLIQVMA